ncbi:hypothetical protein QEH53_22960, partial [Pelagicoccus sp. SDUM812002]
MNQEEETFVESPPLATNQLPLCVDLDGTLIRTDSLHELVLKTLKKSPLKAVSIPFWILEGKASFKARLMAENELKVSLLPYNTEILKYIREARKTRKVYLCTGANEKLAHSIAKHLDCFDGVVAST